MVGQRGPSGGRIAEGESVVVGEVGAEPSGEVERCPGVAVVRGEEGGGLLVELEEAAPLDALSVVELGSLSSGFAVGDGNRPVRWQLGMVGFGVVGLGQAGQPVAVEDSVQRR